MTKRRNSMLGSEFSGLDDLRSRSSMMQNVDFGIKSFNKNNMCEMHKTLPDGF